MQEPVFFMVYVEGQQAPVTKHAYYCQALVEAGRLCKKMHRKAYVMRTTNVCVPKTSYTFYAMPACR